MPFAAKFAVTLAALDQLIISREVNLSLLQDQLNLSDGARPRRRTEEAILSTERALHRLALKRAELVMRGPGPHFSIAD
jgi:hypothetical protein